MSAMRAEDFRDKLLLKLSTKRNDCDMAHVLLQRRPKIGHGAFKGFMLGVHNLWFAVIKVVKGIHNRFS